LHKASKFRQSSRKQVISHDPKNCSNRWGGIVEAYCCHFTEHFEFYLQQQVHADEEQTWT